MRFDLLIKGGEIVDPATGYFGPGDVAVRRDRIAAVARDIPAACGVSRDRRRAACWSRRA